MKRLLYEIKRLGLKQRDVARAANVNESSLSRIINGTEPAYPLRGKRIAEAVGWTEEPALLFEDIEIEVKP